VPVFTPASLALAVSVSDAAIGAVASVTATDPDDRGGVGGVVSYTLAAASTLAGGTAGVTAAAAAGWTVDATTGAVRTTAGLAGQGGSVHVLTVAAADGTGLAAAANATVTVAVSRGYARPRLLLDAWGTAPLSLRLAPGAVGAAFTDFGITLPDAAFWAATPDTGSGGAVAVATASELGLATDAWGNATTS
jgi:hypothetical protein